ncbi:MAG TPA: hypothetical protein VLJ21_04205 [Candidatus Binatia bacterium]|nr:hypothetical protein [Candidatus Binatia bacterium]
MALHEDWIHEAESRLRKRAKNTTVVFPPCPACHRHEFEFDPKTGRLKCRSCGFETYLKVANG